VPNHRRQQIRRAGPSIPHQIAGHGPPGTGDDLQLDRVTASVLAADPTGEKFSSVLRETYDQLYDGQRTGRYSWDELRKTEKTHMGTLVEINLHRAFNFDDGKAMDYLIDGVETDCKFSQKLGGWEIPPEAYETGHICLVVWASDETSLWRAGLVRVSDEPGLLSPENRDRKRRLTSNGESRVRWLYSNPVLPENLLLHIPQDIRDRILHAALPTRQKSTGQQRVNMLFRLVQRRIVNRASVMTVARQKDGLKRPRDARLSQHLGQEGILVLGHQGNDPFIAKYLNLPVPKKGDFISARVCPAESDFEGMAAEIAGSRWRLATSADPVVPAPPMPRGRIEDDNE
jgi:hypothetical protein